MKLCIPYIKEQSYHFCCCRARLYGLRHWKRNATEQCTTVQRLINIKIAKAFRTTSSEALCTLTGLTPIVNKAEETATLHRVFLSLEAPNYCLCIQSNSAGFSFVNTGKQVHLKHARRHFERNLAKDVHHRSVASRNWLKC